MSSNITKPIEGSKRAYPPDMILDKDNSDYISQMLREKRQSEETGKQTKLKNTNSKVAVPPFMKGLHQMQQMQLQLAQKQQQSYQQSVSSQSEEKKQTIIKQPAVAAQQQPQSQSTLSSENSTQSSQSKVDNANSLNANSKVIQGQQQKNISSQIPAFSIKDNSQISNNNSSQDTQSVLHKQTVSNSQGNNGQFLGQKQSTQQPKSQSVYQDNSINANLEKQPNNSPQENKSSTAQSDKISSIATQNNSSGETKVQEDKATQRKTIHSQQPKLFDQFFRNENNNAPKIVEQKQQLQERIVDKSYENNMNNNNARTTKNSNITTSSKITGQINTADNNNNNSKNIVDNQLENDDRIINKRSNLNNNKSNESRQLDSQQSQQFAQTTRKQNQELQQHPNELQLRQQNQLESKQKQQHYYQLQPQASSLQGEFINASLESSLTDIQQNFLARSKNRNVSPIAQFNSNSLGDQGSFNISNISNIQDVSNHNINNLSSMNNHSNNGFNPNQPRQQDQNVSFHEHHQDQLASEIRQNDEEQNNRSAVNNYSTHQKNSLQFLHVLDSYIDYFEATSARNSSSNNNNANLSRQQQQDIPQTIYPNRAFLINQLEQLTQKYKESETSRGILISDLSKAKNRHLQLKKKMQVVLVRIAELESALNLTNNRLLYTKEQLARDNVELENTKFTLQQVLQNDRNIGTLRGEDLGQYYQGNTSQLPYKNQNFRRNTQPHPFMNISVSPRISIPDYLSKTSLREQPNPQEQQFEYPIQQTPSSLQYSKKPQQYSQHQAYPKSNNSRSSMNVSPDKNRSQFNSSRIYENGEKGIRQQNYHVLSQVQESDQGGIENYQDEDEFDLDISSDQYSSQPQDEFQIQQQDDQYEDSNLQFGDQQRQQYQPESRTYEEQQFDSNLEENYEYLNNKQHSNNTNKYQTVGRLQGQQVQGKLNKSKNDQYPNISTTQGQQQQQIERSQGMSSNHKKAMSLDEEEHLYQMLRLKHFEGQNGGRNISSNSTPYSSRKRQQMSSIGEMPSNGYNPVSYNASNYTSFPDNLISQKIQFNSVSQPQQINNNFNNTPNVLSHPGRTMSLSYSKPSAGVVAAANSLESHKQFYLNQNQFTNYPKKQIPF